MKFPQPSRQLGVTLLELVVFIVVVSIALTTLVAVMNQQLVQSVDPLSQVRALECAQAKLDTIIARRFDENTPSGGIPACGSGESGAEPCAGITGSNTVLDNVGAYHNHSDSTTSCSISVSVSAAGGDLGLANDDARLVIVTASSPGGGEARLATYRSNF